jgi:ribonuclease HI
VKKQLNEITIYTDGSCHTQAKIGGWAAIIISENKETVLKGSETDTTHNQMELLAVIEALRYVKSLKLLPAKIDILSDSQYVINIQQRAEKLKAAKYITKKGNLIQNKEYIEQLIYYIETMTVNFIKVKAHLKKSSNRNYNRDVDKLSRKLVRDLVKNRNPE